MIQCCAKWAGPLNFGIHVSLKGVRYIDIHLPYTVLTLGNIKSVEYPPWWWACGKDISSGIKYTNPCGEKNCFCEKCIRHRHVKE